MTTLYNTARVGPSLAPSSHAVERTTELLSCARTAVKIARRQHPETDHGWYSIDPNHLQLHTATAPSSEFLEDGLALLHTMESELKQLEALVRRRGHTNDPTEEITASVRRLETDTKELSSLISTMIPPSTRGQARRHWQILQQWFQTTAEHQGKRLQEILKVRSTVLAEQAQRRKLFQAKKPAAAAKTYDNPLFTMKAPPAAPRSTASQPTTGANGHAAAAAAPASAPRPNGYYQYYQPANTTTGGYQAGLHTGGYGGGAANAGYYAGSAHTGMRQRKTAAAQSSNEDPDAMQAQLLVRQQERATQQRLHEARQAETSLVELGTLFSKMTSLLSAQSEVIDKVEDDVEAAVIDVDAGHEQITILYSIKKGNRALILKVFGLLIFFIVFMRFYRN